MTLADLKLFTMASDGTTSIHSLALKYEFAAAERGLHIQSDLPHVDVDEAMEAAVWAFCGRPYTEEERDDGTEYPGANNIYAYLEAHPELLGFPPAGQNLDHTFTITDPVTGRSLWVKVTGVGNFLKLHPEGYGNPVSLDFHEGRLRVLLNADVDDEQPDIIGLEMLRAAEPGRRVGGIRPPLRRGSALVTDTDGDTSRG